MYSCIFGALAILSFFEVCKDPRKTELIKKKITTNIIYIFIVLILIIFAGTRVGLGTDYNNYIRIFSNSKSDDVSLFKTEVFFIVLARMVDSFNIYLLIVAIISVSLKCCFIWKKSSYVFTSLFIYYSYIFLQYDMGIIRQGLAISITLYASSAIQKRNFKRFLFLTILGMLFHYSSCIFFIAYFLGKKEIPKYIIYGISAISIIISFSNFWKIITYFLTLLSNMGFSKYMGYLTNEAFRAQPFNILDLQRMVLLVFFVEILRKSSDEESKDQNNVYINIYFICTILYYLFRTFSAISSRGTHYFSAYEIIIFPQALKGIKNPYKRLIVFMGILLYCCIYAYKVLHQHIEADYYNSPFIPYNSWLF